MIAHGAFSNVDITAVVGRVSDAAIASSVLTQPSRMSGSVYICAGTPEAERVAWADRRSAASSRLGGEFHILLARETGNDLLERYMSEVVSRTALILAIYGRDIDQQASIDEHEELLALLADGKAERAAALVTHHLDEVERKTLRPQDPGADPLLSVLSRH